MPDLTDKHQSYVVTVDSSKLGQGATLTQMIDGRRRVIAYWSRAVPPHQRKFGATRLELIALHGALKHWELYLLGTKFLVKTDCKAMTSLERVFKKENSYIQRRLADLSRFNFELVHVSGKSTDIAMADFLSRYAYEAKPKTASTQTDGDRSDFQVVKNLSEEGEIDKSKPVSIDEIRSEYKQDRVLKRVIEWLKEGSRPRSMNHRASPQELCHYWKNFDLLSWEGEVLYRRWYDCKTGITSKLIVIPFTLVERILYTYHDTMATCHAGVEACIEQCLRKCYFYKLKKEFKLYIQSCVTCARAKQPKAYLRAPMKPTIYSSFAAGISIDHLEISKKPTARGIVALLTIVDMYSGYLACIPVKSVSTEASIKAILEHWILRFGVPEVITHDLGTGFTSGLWRAIMKAFDIKDAKTTPKHSQANGKAEAYNRKINQCLRVALNEDQWKNYDIYVKYIVFCLNSLKSNRTDLSPNFLVYGTELRMPRDILFNDDSTRIQEMLMGDIDLPEQSKAEAYSHYRQMAEVSRKVLEKTEARVGYQITQYNKRISGPFFEVGDWCMMLELWPKHKISKKFRGPYQIIEKFNDHNYVIMIEEKRKVVNISKMKHFKRGKYSEKEAKKPTKVAEEPKKVPRRADSSSDEDELVLVPSDTTPHISRSFSNRSSVTKRRESGIFERDVEQYVERAPTPDAPVDGQARDVSNELNQNGAGRATSVEPTPALSQATTWPVSPDRSEALTNTSPRMVRDDQVPGGSRQLTREEWSPLPDRRSSEATAGPSSGTRSTKTKYGLREKPAQPERYGSRSDPKHDAKSTSNTKAATSKSKAAKPKKLGLKIKSPFKKK